MSAERTFTAEDANAELAHLRELLPRLREARRALIAASVRIDEAVASDGGGVAASEWFSHQRELRTALEDLADRGIVLRDPESGLVDFPAERDGEPVFLCWRLGEPAIAHYHAEHAGFGGRRPL